MVVILLLATALPAAAQKPTPQNANPAPPRVFLLNAQELATLRSADANDPRRQELVHAVMAAADRAMTEGPFSVMDKPVLPPSGDKHDYMSRATYFWPDPSKPDGLPYIRHDGQTNPGEPQNHRSRRVRPHVRSVARPGLSLVFHRQCGLRQPRRASAAHLVSRSRHEDESQPRIRPGHHGRQHRSRHRHH